MEALADFESRLGTVSIDSDDDQTLQGSALSRASTFKSKAKSDGVKIQSIPVPNVQTSAQLSEEDSDVSESETSDGEHVTLEEINRCAIHVTKLLKRISALQQTFETGNRPHGRLPKRRVRKLYRRFCQKIETEMRLDVNTLDMAKRNFSRNAKERPLIPQLSHFKHTQEHGMSPPVPGAVI